MDCLNNRIGIKGCGAPTTPAVVAIVADPSAMPPVLAVAAKPALPILVINDLPGITTKMIDSLVNNEQDTYLDVFNKISRRAQIKLLLMIKAEVNKCHRVTDNDVITCLVCAKKELFDVCQWYLYGVETMIEITNSDEVNRYNTVDLDKVEQLKSDFYAEFSDALTDAVKSLDPKDSDCITGCLESNENIQWKWAHL